MKHVDSMTCMALVAAGVNAQELRALDEWWQYGPLQHGHIYLLSRPNPTLGGLYFYWSNAPMIDADAERWTGAQRLLLVLRDARVPYGTLVPPNWRETP